MARLILQVLSRIAPVWVSAVAFLYGGVAPPNAARCDRVVVGQPEPPPSQRDRSSLPDFACGPAAAAIVLELCAIAIDNTELDNLRLPDGSSNLADIASLLRSKGLFVDSVRLSPRDLAQLPCPAILHAKFSLYPDLPPADHFTVCASSPFHDDKVVILDPLALVGRGLVPRDVAAVKMSGPALLVSTKPIDLTGLGLASEPESAASPFPLSRFALPLGAALLSFGVTWLMARPHSKAPGHAPPVPDA